MPRSTAPGTSILVELVRDDTFGQIAVEDHGIGMTDGEAAQVFEPFYRGQTVCAGGSPGLGPGLAVAVRLAQVFGGTIDVASKLGHGSRFVVRLPLIAENA